MSGHLTLAYDPSDPPRVARGDVRTCGTRLGRGVCGSPAPRQCVQCGAAVCDEHALYRGTRQPPGVNPVKCDDCDYRDYQNTYGGI